MAGALAHAVSALEDTLEAERARADRSRSRSAQLEAELRTVRETAAMYQERARNLEEETKRLHAQLALPAPQPEPALVPDPVAALRAKVDELSQ